VKRYKSRSGKESGVIGYNTGDDFITVQFKNGAVYTYSYKSENKYVVEKMKALATGQMGLATFISTHQPRYE
jgi:hypothetical protein